MAFPFLYQDLCLKSLNTLDKSGLIKMDDGFDLKPTGKKLVSHPLTKWVSSVFSSFKLLNSAEKIVFSVVLFQFV